MQLYIVANLIMVNIISVLVIFGSITFMRIARGVSHFSGSRISQHFAPHTHTVSIHRLPQSDPVKSIFPVRGRKHVEFLQPIPKSRRPREKPSGVERRSMTEVSARWTTPNLGADEEFHTEQGQGSTWSWYSGPYSQSQ